MSVAIPQDSGRLTLRIVVALAGALPPLILSGALVTVWVAPHALAGGSWVKLAAGIAALEFLLLHSGAFMAVGPMLLESRWHRLGWFLGFGIFYTAAILGFSYWAGGNYGTWLLVWVMLSRLLTLVILDDKRGTMLMFLRSAIGMPILVLTALLSLLPWPELGLTDAVRYAAFGYADDAIARQPERTIAWGVVYFSIMTLIEWFIGWRLPDWTDEQVDASWRSLSNKAPSLAGPAGRRE